MPKYSDTYTTEQMAIMKYCMQLLHKVSADKITVMSMLIDILASSALLGAEFKENDIEYLADEVRKNFLKAITSPLFKEGKHLIKH